MSSILPGSCYPIQCAGSKLAGYNSMDPSASVENNELNLWPKTEAIYRDELSNTAVVLGACHPALIWFEKSLGTFKKHTGGLPLNSDQAYAKVVDKDGSSMFFKLCVIFQWGVSFVSVRFQRAGSIISTSMRCLRHLERFQAKFSVVFSRKPSSACLLSRERKSFACWRQ